MIGICEDLRKSVLQAAIQGRLTQQLPEDGDAESLYADIQKEKQKLIKEGRIKKEKPLPEITEDDIPFDIPENWKWVRIGEILDLQAGKNITAANIYPESTTEHPFPCFGGNNIRGYVKDYNRSGEHAIIGRQGALCGNVKKASGLFYATEHAVVVTGFAGLCIDWQYYFLTALNLNQYATATAQPGLAVAKINDVFIPLPPLAEQKRIVARVDELMARIDEMEKTERDISTLYDAFPGDMKASLLQAAIQGKITEQLASDGDAETLYQDIQKEKQRLIKEGKLKKEKPLPEITEDDIPFDIPENWKWIRFGDCFDYHIGKTPPRKEPVYWKEEFPWVSIADMIDGNITQKTKERVSDYAVATTFSNRVSSAGTLLMSFKLTVGKVSILGMDAVHNEAIISIYPIRDIDNITRNYLFKILPFVANSGDTKNAIKGKTLNSESISNLLVPLPPLMEQRRIVEKLDQLQPLCDSMKEAIDA